MYRHLGAPGFRRTVSRAKNSSVEHLRQATHLRWLIFPGLFALLSLLLFGDLLFSSDGTVVSYIEADTSENHLYLRALGAKEIRQGNLPLWNPHLFSGTPFLGSMQAGLLYPLNVIYLFLPIVRAINTDVALHLALLGLFTYIWLRGFNLSRVASCYGGIVTMLCGATFLRVFAGQLNVIATLAWAPLLLASIDRVISHKRPRQLPSGWCLIGVSATSMLALAGYPQALFVTAVVCAIYSVMRLPRAEHTLSAVVELATVALLPLFLTAIQLWTGFATGMESVRGGGVSYEFASSFSLAPEKLLTMVAPSLYGDFIHVAPWGRWGFKDDNMYVGIVTLLLLPLGVLRWRSPLTRVAVAIGLVSVVVALGRYTPLHGWLYEFVPGFDRFRSPTKFLFFTGLACAALAAIGIESVYEWPDRARRMGIVGIVGGALLLLSGLTITLINQPEESSLWLRLLEYARSSPDVFLWREIDSDYVQKSSRLASTNLFLTGTVGMLAGTLLLASRRYPTCLRMLIGLGIAELIVFAMAHRDTFRTEDLRIPKVDALLATDLGEVRLHHAVGFENRVSNYPLAEGGNVLWGFDPVILERYADLMSTIPAGLENEEVLRQAIRTWGADPFGEAYKLGLFEFSESDLNRVSTMLRMLRCGYVIQPVIDEEYENFLRLINMGTRYPSIRSDSASAQPIAHAISDILPRFVLVNGFEVAASRNDALRALHAPTFDPRLKVILESEPLPSPAKQTAQGIVRVLDQSTDHATLNIELSDPAILLVTDAYAEGWRAVPVGESVQSQYEILPANVALRAIPLSAGTHTFRMEYLPASYRYGRLSSMIAFGIYLALVVLWAVNRNERRREQVDTAAQDEHANP